MCGICGFIDQRSGTELRQAIDVMTLILSHRGPDHAGVQIFTETGVALGHCRLKVIDLSDRGRQPMPDASQQVWITYNGEVYNFKELRRELTQKGYVFHSATDTEVVLAAYLYYGPDFVHRLNGDFAFAIWDNRTRDLFLYRDRVGLRPLYYMEQDGLFLFASEIKAIFCHPGAGPARPDWDRIPEYFGHLSIFGEETLFAGVRELEPGCGLQVHDGKIRRFRYHDFFFDASVRDWPQKEQMQGFAGLFKDSLGLRLESDVPLGVYLSGGMDSSYLTACLSADLGRRAHTYSLGFENYALNELVWSDEVARLFNTTHTRFQVSEQEFISLIDRIIWHYDEPTPHMVSIPQYCLAREARKHLTVALSGSGGDELLAGYDHYRAALRRVETGPNEAAQSTNMAEAYQQGLSPALLAAEFKSCSQKYVVDKLFTKAIPDYRDRIARYYAICEYPDFLSRMLYMDLRTHLVAVMNKDDKLNMAWGIEGRHPYLDYRLVQFALSMSPHLKVRHDSGKWCLKQLGLRFFDETFVRRPKQAFPTPAEQWLQSLGTGWIHNSPLLDFDRPAFNKDNLVLLATDPGRLCMTGNPGRRQWGVYCLDRWLRNLERFPQRPAA